MVDEVIPVDNDPIMTLKRKQRLLNEEHANESQKLIDEIFPLTAKQAKKRSDTTTDILEPYDVRPIPFGGTN